MKAPLVLYHADMDGYASACVVAAYLHGLCECRAVQYGDACPVEDARGRAVYVVDFAWPLPDMERLHAVAASLTWVDHHATSAAGARELERRIPRHAGGASGEHAVIVHDYTRCGAVLTWQTLYGPAVAVPMVLSYVQDRDLWQWRLPDSREVSAALALLWPRETRPPETAWSAFLEQNVGELVPTGAALLAAQRGRVERFAARAEPVDIDGRPALAVNATGDISEIGEYLCERGAEVAIVYFREGPRGWVWSLRSRGEVDVSLIAKARGGGGHKNAAGFTAPRPPVE